MSKLKKVVQKKEKPEKEKKEEKKKIVKEKKVKKLLEVKDEKKLISKPKTDHYLEAVGRRKTAVARVRLFTKGEKDFLINGKLYNIYFPTLELQQIVLTSLEKMKCFDKFRIQVLVKGGGYHSQAEAVRHGIARALVLFNIDFKKRLKKVGYLTRDSRMRERKKFGLKRARRAPQWSKR